MKQIPQVCANCPMYTSQVVEFTPSEGHYCVLSRFKKRVHGKIPNKNEVPPECQRLLEHVILGQEKS